MSENIPTPEPQLTPESQIGIEPVMLQELRERRLDTKVTEATNTLVKSLTTEHAYDSTIFGFEGDGNWDRLKQHGSGLTDGRIKPGASDTLFISAIGQVVQEPDLVNKLRALKRDEEIKFDTGPDAEINIYKYSDDQDQITVTLNPKKDSDPDDVERSMRDFKSRIDRAQAPFKDAKTELALALNSGELEAFSSQSFNFKDNPDELINFINRSRLTSSMFEKSSLAQHKLIEKMYNNLPVHYAAEKNPAGYQSQEGIYFDEQGRLEKVLIGCVTPGTYLALKPETLSSNDITEQALHLGVVIDPAEAFVELDYNARHYESVEPFIETPTALQLIDAFESSGLTLNDELKDMFSEIGKVDTRYGHGYSAITRELSKLVNDPERPLGRFFEDSEQLIQKVASLQDVDDPGAQAIIDILRSVVSRGDVAGGNETALPVSKSRIEIKDGGCKDAEVYLASGRDITYDSQGAPLFLASTYSRASAITLQPTVFNGVRLPAGTLMAIEDDGYVMMRLTGYTFTPEEATVVFGPQDAENKANSSNYNRRNFIEDKIKR